MSTFANERRRARKNHPCDGCPDTIAKGEMHETWMFSEDGSAERVRVHDGCAWVLREWWKHDEYFSTESVPDMLRDEPAPPLRPEWSEVERVRMDALWKKARAEADEAWRRFSGIKNGGEMPRRSGT